jgi:hypothetical protein
MSWLQIQSTIGGLILQLLCSDHLLSSAINNIVTYECALSMNQYLL